jgi:hypothetical protein
MPGFCQYGSNVRSAACMRRRSRGNKKNEATVLFFCPPQSPALLTMLTTAGNGAIYMFCRPAEFFYKKGIPTFVSKKYRPGCGISSVIFARLRKLQSRPIHTVLEGPSAGNKKFILIR